MKKFLLWLRATFVSGLLAILPIGATAYILWILYNMLDGLLGRGPADRRRHRARRRALDPGTRDRAPHRGRPRSSASSRGTSSGRTLYSYFERVFLILPGVRKMFGTFKQFAGAHARSEGRSASFKQVVLIEYPEAGDVCSRRCDQREPRQAAGRRPARSACIVYVPTVPNPVDGRLVVVPKRLVTYVDMPVEDMLSMVRLERIRPSRRACAPTARSGRKSGSGPASCSGRPPLVR